MKKHWLGSNVIFPKENNLLKIVMISNIYLKLIVVFHYICGEPLLFLIDVNYFYLASKFKNVMFADDTNLFISNENIGELFQQMNKELKKISICFKANRLSIDIDKTKWTIFCPTSKKFHAYKISRTIHSWHNSRKRNSHLVFGRNY